jgi:hypothetical protein
VKNKLTVPGKQESLAELQKRYLSIFTRDLKLQDFKTTGERVYDRVQAHEHNRNYDWGDVSSAIKKIDELFLAWFANASMMYHGDDVY